MENKEGVFIVWGPFGHRMDELAQIFNGKRISITAFYGIKYLAPLRYLFLFFKTLIILFAKNPSFVYSQNPPVFCPFTCLIYCSLTRKKHVIDHHALWSVKTVHGFAGKVIRFMEVFTSRASYLNTCPHEFWEREISKSKSRVMVIHDFVEENPYRRNEELRNKIAGRKMVAICSHGGHELERIENEIYAVSGIEEIHLVITGPEEKLRKRLSILKMPQNVSYLGMLSKEEYLELKASADFAINITDEPYTLSHVILEYAASSLPIISSMQEPVYLLFGDSLIYSDSRIESIREKVMMLVTNREMIMEYKERIRKKFREIREKRKREEDELRKQLNI